MPSSTVKYGYKGKIYFNSGVYGTPTYNDITNVRDVMIGADFTKTDATTRAGVGLKQSEPTLLDLMLTGKIRKDETDTTGYLALENATLNRASLDILILDNAITVNGSRGYRFDAKNFKLGEDQNLDGIVFIEFELAPCVSGNIPQKVVITGAVPVYSPLG
jgi:hypothetical protein